MTSARSALAKARKPMVASRRVKFKTHAGVEVEMIRNRTDTQCRFTAWDEAIICPHCNDQVLPGYQHTCVRYTGVAGSGTAGGWSKRDEKVQVFER